MKFERAAAPTVGGVPVPPQELVASITRLEQATRKVQQFLVVEDGFSLGAASATTAA